MKIPARLTAPSFAGSLLFIPSQEVRERRDVLRTMGRPELSGRPTHVEHSVPLVELPVHDRERLQMGDLAGQPRPRHRFHDAVNIFLDPHAAGGRGAVAGAYADALPF